MSDKTQQYTRISKFLSYVLRHNPTTIGLELDRGGWVAVEDLLANSMPELTLELLEDLIATNAKQRFAFSADRLSIRASQGHSLDVDLGYEPVMPPELLYHGTARKFLPSIHAGGLRRMKRHHVHLSQDQATAEAVGARRGPSVVLTTRAGEMHRQGLRFFVSANNVWLTDHVPAGFIEVPGN